MKKRLLSLLLILCMVLGMLPMTASAAEAENNSVTVYFTVEKGIGFVTAGGKTMGMQKLTVPYFDGECACGAKESDAENVIPGDMNGDKKVTIMDVSNAFNAYMKNPVLTEQQKAAADKNADGKISMSEFVTVFNIYMNQ